MDTNNLRVGILSFAHMHAESYAHNLTKMPGISVIGAADDNAERGRYFAQRYNLSYFDSYEALLAQKPDAVVVTSENARHLPLVELAAKSGAHVLCEKPLATTVDDAKKIVQVCKDAGVTLMTAFPMRFSPATVEVKTMLDRNGLGTIYGCNTTNQGSLPEAHQAEHLAFLKRDWFVDPQLAGGGAMTDHIVHLADLMRWFFGVEVREVYAQSNNIMHEGRVQVETAGLVMLTFTNGIIASIDCSWSKPAYYPTWGGLKMEFVGEKGLVTMDAFKQNITIYSHQVGRPKFGFWGSDIDGAMIADFISAIREKRAPRVTGEDGLRAVEIVAAAYQSVQNGQPVTL